MKTAAVILAAGQGTRMQSVLPKVLHPLLGKPLIHFALSAAQQATGEKPVVVIGHAADTVRRAVGEAGICVVQEPQAGTGHAVQQASALLQGQADCVLVTYADMPLLSTQTLNQLISLQQAHSGPLTMLTMLADDPRGFGRVVRSATGQVQAIIEEAQATPEDLQIRELNVGVYCFQADWLWDNLPRIPLSPKGEYYLTDLIGIAVAQGFSVQAVLADDASELIGINTRLHLAEAESRLRQNINRQWMLAGITLVDPATTYIEPEVRIGQDTVIWPNTHLRGKTTIGENCCIGPNSIVSDTQIGSACTVLASVLEQAILEDHVQVGPFGHLRKGAHLAEGVHMGNFGEVKNSYLGPGVKVGHFSYLGDATIGAEVNIGAGTITCNFDGVQKNATQIGAGSFIGSDTMLVAPLTLGERSRTGAGSVVTKNVAPDTLVVGVPARAIRKLPKRE